MSFSRDYLGRITETETPTYLDIATNFEAIYDHCQLRNAARDLLQNPEDAVAQRKLSHLIVKLRVN